MKGERHQIWGMYQDLNPGYSGDRGTYYHSATKPEVTRTTLHTFLIKELLPMEFIIDVILTLKLCHCVAKEKNELRLEKIRSYKIKAQQTSIKNNLISVY